jgi:peroxiredoxin
VVKVGDKAPDASVFTKPGESKTLRELRGDAPGVILFFPLAFSGVCTKEMCAIADNFAAWNDVGARVVAISVDSPFTNMKFAESTNASFPIVSDFNHEAMRAFDVERDDLLGMKGVSERAAFVIDRSGIVRYAWVGENPGVFPPLEEIRETVATLSQGS